MRRWTRRSHTWPHRGSVRCPQSTGPTEAKARSISQTLSSLRLKSGKPTAVGDRVTPTSSTPRRSRRSKALATTIYRAGSVQIPPAIRRKLERFIDEGHGGLPVCIAKTPYSLSSDPTLRGAPQGHELTVRDVRLSAGAGFIVVICGDIMTMPGLPASPAAYRIDVAEDGTISGLF